MQNLFPGMTTPEPGLVPCIKKLLPESISDSSLLTKLFFSFRFRQPVLNGTLRW